MRHIRIVTVDDIHAESLQRLVRSAIELNQRFGNPTHGDATRLARASIGMQARIHAQEIIEGYYAAFDAHRNDWQDLVTDDVVEPQATLELTDCDFLFLAADSHQARMISTQSRTSS